MRDVLDDVLPWYRAGTPFAVATVVRTWKSAPRQPGASMAVSATGNVVASVSGGCVEGAVYELAQDVIRSGQPRLVSFGVNDEDALTIGLTCGGVIEIFIDRIDGVSFPDLEVLADAAKTGNPAAVVTRIDDDTPTPRWSVVQPDGSSTLHTDHVQSDVRGMLAAGRTGVLSVCNREAGRRRQSSLMIESFTPPPRMLVFGAIDFAATVVRIGKFLGYHVTVCDVRPVFATPARFPEADEVVVAWPHRYLAGVEVDRRTAICVLTHDPKFDLPLLVHALRTDAGYIGAMGSQRTHDDRLDRLLDVGLTESELARLSSPIGLHLGGRTPEETAISIAAEIIAGRCGGSGEPMSRRAADARADRRWVAWSS